MLIPPSGTARVRRRRPPEQGACAPPLPVGGSELQIADSEAITSTVLLREMHAQMHEAAVRRGRRGAPPLTIVTQVRRLDTGLPPLERLTLPEASCIHALVTSRVAPSQPAS